MLLVSPARTDTFQPHREHSGDLAYGEISISHSDSQGIILDVMKLITEKARSYHKPPKPHVDSDYNTLIGKEEELQDHEEKASMDGNRLLAPAWPIWHFVSVG